MEVNIIAIAIIFLEFPLSNTKSNKNEILFRDDQVIFASNFNITKILVPAKGISYAERDFSDMPSIFFTISDEKLDGGSCIYLLEGLVAYEILEGGRDTTCDYGFDKSIYFGAKDGVYKYNYETLSANKFGPFRDDIIQIQKANGSDLIYYLTSQKKIYKLEGNGTIKTKVNSILCALQFVIDNHNNIYYIDCDDRFPRIEKSDGTFVMYTATVSTEIEDIKLLRPAFVMDNCMPFIADGFFFVLHANGTKEEKKFYMKEKPSAFSIDAGLYFVAALDGKIYEFNAMDVVMKYISKSHEILHLPQDFLDLVMSMVELVKDNNLKIINLNR